MFSNFLVRVWPWQLFGAVLAILLSTPALALGIAPEFVDEPDWVDELELDWEELSEPPETPSSGSTNLLIDHQIRLADDGRTDYRRVVFRVDGGGGNKLTILRSVFRDTKEYFFHSVSILKADGSRTALEFQDIGFSRREDAIYIPELERGDIVDVRYSSQFARPLTLELLTDSFSTGYLGGKRQRLVVRLPKKYPAYIVEDAGEQNLKQSLTGSEQVFVVTKGFDEHSEKEAEETRHTRKGIGFGLSAFQDWEEVSSRVHALMYRRIPPTLHVIKLAERLGAGKVSADVYVNSLQNLFESEIDATTHWNPLSQRFDWTLPDMNRMFKYEACNDFECIALFYQLLQEADIDVEPVLGWWGSSLENPFESLRYGGPELLFLVTADKKIHWVSFVDFPYGQSEELEADKVPARYGHILSLSEVGELPIRHERPPASEANGSVKSTFDFSSGLDQSWTLREEVYEGNLGYPGFGESLTDAMARRALLERSYPGIELISTEIYETPADPYWGTTYENQFVGQPLVAQETAGANRPFFFFVEYMPNAFVETISSLNEGNGDEYDHPQFVEVETKVLLPQGVNLAMSNFSDSVSTPYFELTVEQKMAEDELTRLYSFKTLKEDVAEEHVADHITNLTRALQLVGPWSISYQPE